MQNVFGPFLLATVGYVGYHLFQKSVPVETPPLLATAVAYAVGLVGCLLGFTLSGSWEAVNWRQLASVPTLGVGIAIVGIELGYLLAYRAGGTLGNTALWVSAVSNVLLVVAGVMWGQERLDLARVAGLGSCLFGLALMSR